jgi:hypothetical protein
MRQNQNPNSAQGVAAHATTPRWLKRHRLTRTLSISVGMVIGMATTTFGPQLAHAAPTLKAPSLLQELMAPVAHPAPPNAERA